MRIAIISVTNNGKTLSNILKKKLDKQSTIIKVDLYFKNVKSTINTIFDDYDAIIGIMATGILIRSIAPKIKSKDADPAVLSIDENSNFVISLLSGHIGGANQLTILVSSLINAVPVITTATDINNFIALDSLANKFFWKIENINNIVIFNKALLNGKTIDLIVNDKQEQYLKNSLKNFSSINLIKAANFKEDNIIAKVEDYSLKIYSRKMVVGIGAKKNISEEKVLNAIKNACGQLEIEPSRIDFLSTVDIKSKEKGIIFASKKLNLPINIIQTDKIKNFRCDDCTKSKFVEKTIGAYGVCEPTALITAGKGSRLIFKKTAFNGVTIAVAIGV
jgi:cobalt-precorrin 5A hydrolase